MQFRICFQFDKCVGMDNDFQEDALGQTAHEYMLDSMTYSLCFGIPSKLEDLLTWWIHIFWKRNPFTDWLVYWNAYAVLHGWTCK